MKIKMKALVAATALAIGAQAQAAINDDNAFTPGGGTGAGELFLSVIDRGAAQPMSYVLDLGITADQFMANDAPGYSLNFAADANLLTLLNNPGGTVSWNLTAVHNDYGPSFDDLGYLSTAPTAPVANSNTVTGIIGLSDAITKAGIYLQSVNAAMGANNSVLVTNPSANAFHDTFWGDTWHASTHSTEAGLGDSMGFYYVATNVTVDGDGSSSRLAEFLGTWSLAANGTLTYATSATPPPAVPVPAAVWLLGSALVGLVGVARRKSEDEQV
jgi:hypothetical protein